MECRWTDIKTAVPTEEGNYIVTYDGWNNRPSIMLAYWTNDIENMTFQYYSEKRGGFVYYSYSGAGERIKELANVTAWMKAPEAYS